MKMRLVSLAMLCALVPAVALAQMGGGGGGGGGHGGRGGKSQGQPKQTPSATPSAPIPADTPLSDIVIVGVVREIDPVNERLTIAYEPVDALNWPAGSKPFEVSRTDLMKGVEVGQKIRFKLDSQQISDLQPY